MIEARTFTGPMTTPVDRPAVTFSSSRCRSRTRCAPALSGRRSLPISPCTRRTDHAHAFRADDIALGLSESIALNGPSLCFKCDDRHTMAEIIERHGLQQQKFPGFEGAFAVLQAPEGTMLYLFDEDFLGESYVVAESEETP